jgi:hypothetical protein
MINVRTKIAFATSAVFVITVAITNTANAFTNATAHTKVSLDTSQIAQAQAAPRLIPIIIQGGRQISESFRNNGIPLGTAVLESARGYARSQQNVQSPMPSPVFSQNRYGYTQTCNQYGCVSVPNH